MKILNGFYKQWNNRFAGAEAFNSRKQDERYRGVLDYKSYSRADIVYKLITGHDPIYLAYLDGDRTNDRIENLRLVSSQSFLRSSPQQTANPKNVKGVSWKKDKRKWKAYLTFKGKQIHLGYFDYKEEAIAARLAGEKKYCSPVNFTVQKNNLGLTYTLPSNQNFYKAYFWRSYIKEITKDISKHGWIAVSGNEKKIKFYLPQQSRLIFDELYYSFDAGAEIEYLKQRYTPKQVYDDFGKYGFTVKFLDECVQRMLACSGFSFEENIDLSINIVSIFLWGGNYQRFIQAIDLYCNLVLKVKDFLWIHNYLFEKTSKVSFGTKHILNHYDNISR